MDAEIVTPDNQAEVVGKQQDRQNSGSNYSPEPFLNPADFLEKPAGKRKALTLKEKGDIIEAYDQNPLLSKVELARRFNLSRTTLHSIVAKRDAIAEALRKFGSYSSMRKKSRTSPFQDIEGKLLMWMDYARDLKLPVNGFTLRRQAMVIAKDLGVQKFTASNGWIERFKSRHSDFWKACKGSGTVVKEEKDPIPLEPTVVIKEEPADYDPGPSTSAGDEFILPHKEGWTASSAVAEPQFTFSVACLSSAEGSEPPDAEPLTKKRKCSPSKTPTPATSTNGTEVRSQMAESDSGDFSCPSSAVSEVGKDQFDVFGEYIAAKLRSMDRRSCAFAQKAIGDVIFEAEMGKYLKTEPGDTQKSS